MALQLRRYEFTGDNLERWLPKWHSEVVPFREKWGYRIVFGYVDRERNEFVWMVEYPGTPEEFEAHDTEYLESQDWADTLERYVPLIERWTTGIVEQEWPLADATGGLR
ncbi:hypothetical protein ABCS02_11165 [Microbacterium sp. X-17]|uniref:hypothetical protein n=1 Tax=Microbacterium sp. X-17 TaxID=3144404 RepID=UPI0031F483FF